MATNLYPLVFKPGIKRDGTPNQADYCTNGFWVRFYQGKVRKIGGLLALNTYTLDQASDITTIFISQTFNGFYDNINMFFGDATSVRYVVVDKDFKSLGLVQTITNFPSTFSIDTLWQITSASNTVNNAITYQIICFRSFNLHNIQNHLAGQITLISLTSQGISVQESNKNKTVTGGSGGILYVSPNLYVYGENGLVVWSKPNDILNFPPANSVNISEDKVIFGASIRGGSLSPTLLFWTLSSVIRLTNVATVVAGGSTLNFRVDPVTRDCSILSSRCVVEHNGIFYWPGTDNFYFYNGVVDVLANTMSLRYFYDNIDLNYRQKVFGVKNKKYNEIWWFYPEKLGTPGRLLQEDNMPVPPGTITRAIIYNLTENSWYDTQIMRTCGYWDNVTGNMYTYGCRLPSNTNINIRYFWKHEYQNSTTQAAGEEIPSLGTTTSIISSVTTPTISWVAFNPMKQLTGVDRWLDIQRIEPDFVVPYNPTGQKVPTTFGITINTFEYPQSTITTYAIPSPITQATEKIDIDLQGRYVTFTISSTGMFEMGHITLDLGIGDGR